VPELCDRQLYFFEAIQNEICSDFADCGRSARHLASKSPAACAAPNGPAEAKL